MNHAPSPDRLKQLPSADFRTIPAVPIAFWLMAGTAVALRLSGLWTGSLPIVLAVATVLVFSWLSPNRRAFLTGLIALAVGLLCASLHLLNGRADYTRFLPRETCGTRIEAVVTEPVAGAESPAPWLAAPYAFRARVRRVFVGGRWVECGGKTVLHARDLPVLGYGERIVVSGGFSPVDPPRFRGAFNYRQYLAACGVSRRFNVVTVETRQPPAGAYRLLAPVWRGRDAVLRRVTAGLSDRKAAILAALSLGYRYSLAPELVETFVRSGTVHVFAISGLHTGIVAALLGASLLVLRIPFRWRYALLPVLLGGYVLATGAAPSATRAWLMISVWCAGRALHRPVLPLQAVALAAIALLLWNPRNLMLSGFQFSFVIVGFLVAGWQWGKPWLDALFEKRRWQPESAQPPWLVHQFALRSSQLVFGGMLAWLGSAGLVLVHNAIFVPATVPVNMGISLLLFPTFVLALLRFVVGMLAIPGFDGVFVWVLNLSLGGMETLASLGSRPPASLPVWQAGVVPGFVYYGLALSVLVPHRLAPLRRGAVLGLVTLIGGLLLLPQLSPPRVTLFAGGGLRTPAAALFGVQKPTRPVLVNTGGYAWAWAVNDFLRSRGCAKLEALVITRGRRECFHRAERMLETFRPAALYLPTGQTSPENAQILRALAEQQRQSGGRVRWCPEGSTREDVGAYPSLLIEIDNPPGPRCTTRIAGNGPPTSLSTVALVEEAGGMHWLKLPNAGAGGTPLRIPLPQAEKPVIQTLPETCRKKKNRSSANEKLTPELQANPSESVSVSQSSLWPRR